jgi:DNA-binding NarL/FixJ family response regulator
MGSGVGSSPSGDRRPEAAVTATRCDGPRRVLLVDDSEIVLSALERVVASLPDVRVVAAGTDAQAGIEAAALLQPHLAIVDVNMPGGGPAACRGILEVSPATVVIALSAIGDVAHQERMSDAGAVDFLRKGIHAEELRRRVEAWLQRCCQG